MHGVTSLAELGGTVSRYRERFELQDRNRHKLPAGDSPMDRVIAGEAFTEVVVEVTRPGEKRHRVQQIRSLVVTDTAGKPDCLVLVLEDETARFDAEERFERAFGANPAPAIITRLSDRRYVKVNQGFMDLTGFVREALIGRSMHDYDVLEGVRKRDLAVEHLQAGTTIPQMEASLRVASGDRRTVIMAGQPIEMGDQACMLFTFADLHPRTQAEDALRQSEQRFAVAFRMAPVPMAIIALDGLRLLDVNDAFTAATGRRRDEVIGRTEPDIGLWGTGASREELERQVRRTGHLRGVETQLGKKDGHVGDYLLSAETVTIHGEHCVLTVMLDITARKQMGGRSAGGHRGRPAGHVLARPEDRGEAGRLDRPGRCEDDRTSGVRRHAQGPGRARTGRSGPRRRGDRQEARHEPQHGAQSRLRDLQDHRHAPTQRPGRLGARAGPGRSGECRAETRPSGLQAPGSSQMITITQCRRTGSNDRGTSQIPTGDPG